MSERVEIFGGNVTLHQIFAPQRLDGSNVMTAFQRDGVFSRKFFWEFF